MSRPRDRVGGIEDISDDSTGFGRTDGNEEDEGVEEEQFEISRLNYFQAAMFATIMEDTVTELRILRECNNELRIIKTLADMDILLALKFSIVQPKVNDELDGIDYRNLGCMQYKLDKLAADRTSMTNVLTDTYLNLSMKRNYNAMMERINEIEDRDAHRTKLKEDEARNKMSGRELWKQLRQQRNHFKSVMYDTDLVIDDLKSQVEDSTLNGEVQARYIDNWQRARTEQHVQAIEEKEGAPSDVIKYFRQRSDYEQRVHTEVEMLTSIAINETLQEVESWMNKYDKDMEGMDLKIQIKKNEYQNTLDHRIELEETYAKHDKLMKDWVHFKDEREKARLYVEKMTNSAIIVQAWWRGLLVRLQLGPYKVAKKKGAGPPGGKKKK